MAILHTQPKADHLILTCAMVKPYGQPVNVKPTRSRRVHQVVKPRMVETTPVFVGIAG